MGEAMKKIFASTVLAIILLTSAIWSAKADGFNPYDPTTVPPKGLWYVNGSAFVAQYPGYCGPFKGFAPTAYFPATVFFQTLSQGKNGVYTLSFTEWTFKGNDWEKLIERLNSPAAATYLLRDSWNGIVFPQGYKPSRDRTGGYPPAGTYANLVYVIGAKFVHLAGYPKEWVLELAHIDYNKTNPNSLNASNIPFYEMMGQTDCNSVGGFLSSIDDKGLDTKMPIIAKTDIWIRSDLMTYSGSSQTTQTFTAIGNEYIRTGCDASYPDVGYILTGQTVTGTISNGWLKLQTVNGQTASGCATLQWLR